MVSWIFSYLNIHINKEFLNISDLEGHVSEACLDQSGSIFIQNSFESATPAEKTMVMEEIGHDMDKYITNVYGNYVIQHVVEQGNRASDKSAVANSLLEKVQSFALHQYASNVLEKCIEFCSQKDAESLIDNLIEGCEEGDFTSPFSLMINDKFGNYVV